MKPKPFRDELRGLLDIVKTTWPVTRDDVVAYLQPRAKAITRADASYSHPAWSDRYMTEDIYVELGGDILGVRLPNDSPERGQYAELFVPKTTLADVEAVVGKLKDIPREHYDSPEHWIAYPTVNGHQLRVIVEQYPKATKLVVMVHYET